MTSIADQLMERRAALIKQAQEIAQRGVVEGRDLTVEEQTSFDKMIAEVDALHERAKAIHEGEERSKEIAEFFVGGEERQTVENGKASEFGQWARSAQIGQGFDIAPITGAESRARAKALGIEARAMSASGGVAQDGVYGQLWQYAIAGSQLLQAGVDVINTADGNALPFPVATVHPSTSDTPTAANAALNSSDATVTTVSSTVSKYTFITSVPTELIQDATFNVEGYIAQAAGRELGRRVAKVASAGAVAGFTTAGVTGPVGTTTTLGAQATAGMGTDLLVNLFHSVLPEYRGNAAWTLADPTAALIRNLKASTGETAIWQPSLMAGDPDMILGKPVYVDPFLPTAAANAKTIYFGEWNSLKVRIAGGLRFERSLEAGFSNDQVVFRGIVRCGAVALDPNAVKYFQHSAT